MRDAGGETVSYNEKTEPYRYDSVFPGQNRSPSPLTDSPNSIN